MRSVHCNAQLGELVGDGSCASAARGATVSPSPGPLVALVAPVAARFKPP